MQASSCTPRTRPSERGTVLIIVMCICLGLVSVAVVFGNTMMLEYRASENSLAGVQNDLAIDGARRYLEAYLSERDDKGSMPDIEDYEQEQVRIGDSVYWLIGRGDQKSTDSKPIFGLVDEASKINLNTASVEMLEGLPCMTPELAAAIVDWRDSDSDLTPNGAESQYYLLLNPGYSCKNGPFETVEELRLLLGGDIETLFGEDTNRNGILDPNEDDWDESSPNDDRDGELDCGVLEYVTVYSRQPNTAAAGREINLNEAFGQSGEHRENLMELMTEKFGSERAEEIYNRANATRSDPGASQEFGGILEFYIRGGMTLDEFPQIDDSLTTSDDESIQGLINVNTASEEVLACLPGVNEEMARQLVSYREGKDTELDSVGWVKEVLEDIVCRQISPRITTNSYQFRADIAVVNNKGRGFRRSEFIIDTSNDEPIVLYRRDLGRLGWPLGSEIRRELASGTLTQGRTLFQ